MFGLRAGKMKAMEKEMKTLRMAVQNFQFDPASGTFATDTEAYRGNTYPGDTAMIAAVNKAYNGLSNWGVNITKAVVDIRAAMIGGAGVEVGITEGYAGEAEKEIEFIKDLMDFNNINSETQVAWAVEGGIEGRALFLLNTVVSQHEDGKMRKTVKTTFVPRTNGEMGSSYTVKTNPLDYSDIKSLELTQGNGNPPRTIPPSNFVYRKFGGRVSQINCSTPIVGHIMPQVESIDKAMRDWREINNLYAQPTPTVECTNAADAQSQYDLMTTINWKIGKLLVVGGGTFKMVGPEIDGVVSLLDEITMSLKIVSGTTGIPPHFLGFPDLMQNRATADSLTEVMFAATARERLAWLQLYTSIFRSAILLSNKVFGTSMDPKAVTALLPENAQTRLRQIVEIWLPIFEAKAITRKSFLNRIPGIDAEKESKEVMKDIEEGAYDGVPPGEGNGQLGTNKPGKGSPDPDNTRTKTQLEKRTGGAGRNAK